ncbi:hypothetical protein CEUSTIGMA_g260.t1 [Chlamydomonas eustigma]|uniref:Ion transport domain-containing protein n=1 Tax=Chlamydomonas eustigma TaxID=1157962 RepID=A0A250WPN2_9CHLO|nr:hypothetical protein CEUSTIGMA_g260.t1 [Chlamydomonas eustigma]|eukprot:GAX72805.1 hypothetical protein CEUSTIGMA_g260.t1 [Chlamydomonas eustigma]
MTADLGSTSQDALSIKTSRDVRRERAVARFAHKWLITVHPRGTTSARQSLLNVLDTSKSYEDSDICSSGDNCLSPVWRIFLHGDEGTHDIVQPHELLHLQPGAPLIHGASAVVIEPFHPRLPNDLIFLPSRRQHWNNNQLDFMSILFNSLSYVYILLPSLTREPSWLRSAFWKLRGPDYNQVELHVHWRMNLADKLTFLMTGCYDTAKRQTVKVYRSKRMYNPGEELVLSSSGAVDFVDMQFMVAFQIANHALVEDMNIQSPRKVVDVVSEVMLAHAQHILAVDPPNEGNSSGESEEKVPYGDWQGDEKHEEPHTALKIQFDYKELCVDDWILRLIKNVRRNRLAEVQAMIDQDLAGPLHKSVIQQGLVSKLPPTEKEELMADIAANNRLLEMLCLLVYYCRCAMSFKALTFLIHYFEDVSGKLGRCEGLLLKYITENPSPLSAVAAIIRVSRLEVITRGKSKPTLQLLAFIKQFENLQRLLLLRAQSFVQGFEGKQGQKLMRLQALLDFKLVSSPEIKRPEPVTISDFRPLRVAFADRDAEFMISPIVESFTRLRWTGAELLFETSKTGSQAVSSLNSDLIRVVLSNLGFCNPQFITLGWMAQIWHIHTFSSQAYFNSPRCRWAMRLVTVLLFIILFYVQLIGANDVPSWYELARGLGSATDKKNFAVVNVLFAVWLLGNLVEISEVLGLRSYDDAIRFFSTQATSIAMNVILDVFLLTQCILVLLEMFQVIHLDDITVIRLNMACSSMTPLMCFRILFALVPVVPKLGNMLSTLQGMLSEVILFSVPWVVLTTAYSVMLQSVFMPLGLEQFGTFWDSMFFLFASFAAPVDYTVLDVLGELDLPNDEASTYRVYGILILISYTILSTILMGNLLIAIITNRYKPEKEHSQNVLNFTEIVDQHMFQVENHLLCSPFNVIQLLFFWLPHGMRRKAHPSFFAKFGMVFLDGYAPVTPTHQLLPSGRNEVPHLLFLLVLMPLLMLASILLYCLHIPYCTLYFTLTGYSKLEAQLKALPMFSFKGDSMGQSTISSAPSFAGSTFASRTDTRMRTDSIHSSRTFSNASLPTQSLVSQFPHPSSSPVTQSTAMGIASEYLLRPFQGIARLLLGVSMLSIFGVFVIFVIPTWTWCGAVLWSVFNISWGAFSVGMKCMLQTASQSRRVQPDNDARLEANARLDWEGQERHQRERKLAGHCITRNELMQCIKTVFNDIDIAHLSKAIPYHDDPSRPKADVASCVPPTELQPPATTA